MAGRSVRGPKRGHSNEGTSCLQRWPTSRSPKPHPPSLLRAVAKSRATQGTSRPPSGRLHYYIIMVGRLGCQLRPQGFVTGTGPARRGLRSPGEHHAAVAGCQCDIDSVPKVRGVRREIGRRWPVSRRGPPSDRRAGRTRSRRARRPRSPGATCGGVAGPPGGRACSSRYERSSCPRFAGWTTRSRRALSARMRPGPAGRGGTARR